MLQLYVTLGMLKEGAVDRVRALHNREDGATAAEYGLLVTFIAIVVIGGVTLFGSALSAFFGRLATRVGTWAP